MSKLEPIDLTYITERIITIFCPADCPEASYTQNLQKIILMLQSKHRDDYMVRWFITVEGNRLKHNIRSSSIQVTFASK